MSDVRLLIRDSQQDIHSNQHAGFADAVVAALSDDPETIEDLNHALERFIARPEEGYFWGFLPGSDDRPFDAGIVIVDLAARLVVCDSTYSAAMRAGSVNYHDGKRKTDIPVNFHLSDDWLLMSDVTDWQSLSEQRRRNRRDNQPLDARAVLYGEPLLRFIAERGFVAFRTLGPPAQPDFDDPAYQREYELLRTIHIDWMMTPREDLRGETPREVMVSRHRFVSDCLQDREFQWSRTEQCPPGLDPRSAAYRFGGFGTHEMVVYYDLVRELLLYCRHHLAESLTSPDARNLSSQEFVTAALPALSSFRDEWLSAPNVEFGARVPRRIIENERARIPEGESDPHAMIEDDCPLCQMQAEMPGPVFWNLDGSHMDGDFAFSLWHKTFEEWEQEQREWEEHRRRFDATQAEKERLGVKYPGGGYSSPEVAWETSFSEPLSAGDPLPFRLFAVGAHLGELIVDLKEPPDGFQARPDLVDRLCGAFAGLRQAVHAADGEKAEAAMRFVLVDFCDTLDAVRTARPDLALKGVDLRDKLSRFFLPPSEEDVPDFLGEKDLPC